MQCIYSGCHRCFIVCIAWCTLNCKFAFQTLRCQWQPKPSFYVISYCIRLSGSFTHLQWLHNDEVIVRNTILVELIIMQENWINSEMQYIGIRSKVIFTFPIDQFSDEIFRWQWVFESALKFLLVIYLIW